MSNLRDIEGIIILGLVLMGVALVSALRGLYARSAIPFLVRKPDQQVAKTETLLLGTPAATGSKRKAA